MELKKLPKSGESERVEFKRTFGKEVIISLSAFANTEGGKVVVGAEAFYLTGDIEKYGTGFIRIRHWLKIFREIQYNIRESGDSFIAELFYAETGGLETATRDLKKDLKTDVKDLKKDLKNKARSL
jgi:predicted HTH transcriptional regulator